MQRAFIILFLLLLGAVPAFAQVPQTVQRNQREAEADCRSAGGRPSILPAFQAQLDLNGDGQPDYVQDYTGLDCQGAASFFCGSAGCPLVIFLSPAYRAEGLGHSQSWTVDRTRTPPAMVLSLHGSSCGRAGADSCEVRLAWNGREMARIGAGAPAPRVASPAPIRPAPAPGGETKSGTPAANAPPPAASPPGSTWQVRQGGDGRSIAVVAGPGVVSAFTVMCHQGVPVAALALRARPPAGPVTLSFAGRGGRASVPLAPGGGNVWMADLRNSAVPGLLAGNDSSLELRINGGLQGRLPLQGSTRAVRDALQGCLAF
ncbi:hypothetical protein [Roseomonas sp. AR75]|uniref:hypothetical protein n=1 Tax=Roseomonas sp. AR75 TaxID=2562311 RepID=UPI0010BF744D|nr:hypothetical protein [Roseomonas sp. AR75]